MYPDLEVSIRRVGKIPIIVLSGDIDAYTCSKLKEAIVDLIDKGEFRVVISMSNVNYIDSSGLGTLVGGLRRIGEQNGAMAISGVAPRIVNVFKITGLNKIFAIFDKEEDAIRSVEI